MKRFLILISAISFMFGMDDAAGNWKLSGLRVDYFDIARQDAAVVVYDAYGFGIGVQLAAIPAGALFNHTINGPFTDAMLQGAGVNLNVNLYPDGTGVIGEGSYYPDVDIGTNPDGSYDCITTGQIFPITDSFNWNTENELSFPYVNILGVPSANAWQGQPAYGLGVNGSGVFDNWTATPQQVTTPYVLPGIFLSDGTILSYPAAYGGVTAGAWGGYFRAGDLGTSQMGQDTPVKFLLEWSAIDGWESESGLGDDLTVDEDGDGTEYDRIFGIPYVSSTYINSANPLCDITGGALTGAGAGLTSPIAGDIVAELGGEAGVAALVTGQCLQGVADGAEGACYDAVLDGVYPGCLGQVQDGVEAQCDAAGSPVNAVTGLCFDASQTPEFAGACAYYGAATALVATCLQLGFDEETCAAAGEQGIGGVEAYCVYLTGVDCATAGIDQCDVLTDPNFSLGLCGTLAGALTTSETCEEWADSFEEDFLNETAAQILGMTCSDYSDALAGGYAAGDQGTLDTLNGMAAGVVGSSCPDFATSLQMGLAYGDPTAIATIDGLFAGVSGGMTCTDYGNNYVGMCVEEVAGANTFYVVDPSMGLTWGMFLTYNAVSVIQYQMAGYDLATIAAYFPELFVNDSSYDFDPSCYYTGETCGGRLLMDFAPTCVAEVEAHQIVAEFVDLDELGCEGTGDVAGGFDDLNDNGVWDEEFEGPAGDGIVNVVDVVKLVGHILGDTPLGGFLLCEADLNADGIINVVDVVAMVNIILGGSGKNIDADTNAATHASVTIKGNELIITGDNDKLVQGAQLTLTHGPDFNIVLEDNFVAKYKTVGNTTTIIVVSDGSSDLGAIAQTAGEYEVDSYVVVNTRGEEITADYGFEVVGFELKAAYPNPFNPTTTLEMVLPEAGYVSVKIYNILGQEVATLADGFMQANTAGHKFQWNASNMASGVYFARAEGAGIMSTQKLMLLK